MADRTQGKNILPTIESAILSTKLYRPFVPADSGQRTDLITRLDSNRGRALTLISAPAGYGKSMLASMWLDASDAPGCWVSLDADDNDPPTFLAYVVAAIHSLLPDFSLDLQSLLDLSVFPPASTVARTLLNDLERLPQRILLVLDDLHVIQSQFIYDLLAELLRHPSPHMHLVLITRRDPPLPIASLRAYGRLTEIRARQLRFSSADTASLLCRTLGHEVDRATAVAWTERTEGWAMALNLAAISLRQRGRDEVNPVDVPVDSHYLHDYLLTEVVNRLDPTQKARLLATAWLDRFCPALCAAIFASDANAAEAQLAGKEFVQWLRRENLFLVSLDNENRWFRLHHLFLEHLRKQAQDQYQDDEIAVVQRRAAAWLAREGLIDEAMRHLVLADDPAEAEELVRLHRYEMMNTEKWHRLERWLRFFPAGALEHSALLTSTVGALALHRGDRRTVEATQKRLERLLPDLTAHAPTENHLLGESSVFSVFLAVVSGNGQDINAHAQRALQLLPANALHFRAIALSAIAGDMQMRGEYAGGYRFLMQTLNEDQWTRPIQARLTIYMCMLCVLQGDLTAALEWADGARAIGGQGQLPESLSYARYFLGALHYLRGESDVAEPYLAALVGNYAISAPIVVAMGAFALALIRNERGDFQGADEILNRVSAYVQQTGDLNTLTLIRAFNVELALRRGDLGAAQRLQIGVDFDSRPPTWFFYIPQLTPVKLLLATGTAAALDSARTTLEEQDQRLRAVHRNAVRIEVLAHLAVVCDAQGDTAAADASLTTALLLAQAGRLIRPFLDLGQPMADLLQRLRDRSGDMAQATEAFVTQILAAFPTLAPTRAARRVSREVSADRSGATPFPPELLSAREQQILQMLATDLTPAEIAARNVVSISTVRTQIRHIYRKLDVHSRIEAVNRGRELGIC